MKIDEKLRLKKEENLKRQRALWAKRKEKEKILISEKRKYTRHRRLSLPIIDLTVKKVWNSIYLCSQETGLSVSKLYRAAEKGLEYNDSYWDFATVEQTRLDK